MSHIPFAYSQELLQTHPLQIPANIIIHTCHVRSRVDFPSIQNMVGGNPKYQ